MTGAAVPGGMTGSASPRDTTGAAAPLDTTGAAAPRDTTGAAALRRAARRDGSGAARGVRWMLGAQIALAAAIVGGDLQRIAPGLFTGGGAAPGLDAPVRPGDQTRRFAPADLRRAPAGPGFPSGDTPPRLTWTPTEFDGAPALVLTGEIAPGDAARFADHLDSLASPPASVALHSPGGSVADALVIGRRLRADGIATRITPDAACFSACPYILAAGVARHVSRSAMVGVHQHYFGQSAVLPAFLAIEDVQRGQAEVMAYLDAMGVDPLLMAKAMATPPGDIYILVEAELTAFALATELTE